MALLNYAGSLPDVTGQTCPRTGEPVEGLRQGACYERACPLSQHIWFTRVGRGCEWHAPHYETLRRTYRLARQDGLLNAEALKTQAPV